MHPLDGAYERVKRAGKHLTYLKRRINIFRQVAIDTAVDNDYLDLLKEVERRQKPVTLRGVSSYPVPSIIEILIGEIIYNLRAALDYLVYELAHFDSSSIVDHTQFLIEDCKKDFRSKRNYRLKGVSTKHRADIELLQPYNGCQWTKLIRDLSDPDKHRRLTTSYAVVRDIQTLHPGSTEPVRPDRKMYVPADFSIDIHFYDRTQIITIDTLKQLKLYVTDTLNFFKPDFPIIHPPTPVRVEGKRTKSLQ